nr:receptor-like protein 12 [Quercus suber]
MKIPFFSWLYLITICSLFANFGIFVVSDQCLHDQRDLLIGMKNSLKFNSTLSTKLVHWNKSQNCCLWKGVTCSEKGRVIGLNLFNESISGSLHNSSLFSLQYLENLNLACNKLSSSLIPSQFGNLTNLIYLNLSNAGFEGQIPIEISQLTRLVTLDLSTSSEKGRVIGLNLFNESISGSLHNSSLFSLQYLENLNLACNKLSSSLIPSQFGNLTNLIYLNLSNAGFEGQIPIEISQLTRLVTLDLSTSSLLSVSMLKIENPDLAKLVWNFSELKELYLDGVNISAPGNEWCQALSSSMPNLRVLSMSDCYLSGPFNSSLSKLQSLSILLLDSNPFNAPVPEFFVNFTNLTSLHLSFCGLNGTFPEKVFQILTLQTLDLSNNELLQGALPDSIGNLAMLSRIDLSGCNFNGSIPNSMGNLTQLVYLDMSSNKFNGQIPSFTMAKNLTQINISHNDLEGSINSTQWEELIKLVNLDLDNNSIEGSIPLSLFSHQSLQKLQLSKNKFSGGLQEFNVSSYSLNTLDLSGNNLKGPLPMSVIKLKGLKSLSFSYNKFNGSFQVDSIQQLTNLSSLDLSYNNLSVNYSVTASSLSFPHFSTLKLASCKLRAVPDFLKNQSKLTILDLSKNMIHGEIPNSIQNLTNLFYLNLSYNHLEGPLLNLPSMLTILDLHSNQLQGQVPTLPPSATYLDLSGNNFSSVIPAGIGSSLTFAYFLSLSNNQLSGSIPVSICNAPYLQVLDLSNNFLNGTIPHCFYGMSETLMVLDLRRNKLSGNLSDSFPVNCGLLTLNLNGNLLEEVVPESLWNCKNLEVLDMGNNQLKGAFPCNLKNIYSLRVLILRSNKFYGSIDCGGPNTSWPMLQIVDLASNNITGQLPREYLSAWKAMMDDVQYLQVPILKFSPIYYQDMITVTSKGLDIELVDEDEDIGDENTEDCKDNGDEDEMEGEEIGCRYCVFCSKIDISRKRTPMRISLLSWLFFIPICSLFLNFGIFVVSQSQTCLSVQRDLLIGLKKSLKFNSTLSTKLVQWNETQFPDCCLWKGVNCSKEGRVVGLDLFNESITSGLHNSSLFSLQYLEYLNLAYNKLSSTIPSQFGSLTSLRNLNLSNAGFAGQVPNAISRLRSVRGGVVPGLIIFIVKSKCVEHVKLLSFRASLQKLQSLSIIRLDNNNFSAAPVPEFFAEFRNLTTLRLSCCELNGTFPEKIFQVLTLQTLDLSNNELLQGSLPEFLPSGSFQSLQLSVTSFSGTLPDSIGKIDSLIWKDLLKLVKLDLGYNSLEGNIPDSLFFLPSLRTLLLSNNQFSGRLEFNVSSHLLNTLDLSSNNLEGPVPMSVFELRNLKILSLSSNNFSGSFQLNKIQQLRNLFNLDLSYNSLSIEYIETSSSSSFPQISTLKLASCKLKTAPDFLINRSKLTMLDLSNNEIPGNIPNWIQNLTNLLYLNLSHNLLEGPLLNLPSTLILLDLHSNQLQGQLPTLPPSAIYLDLSRNNFTTFIPAGILSSLSFASLLYLSNNQLSGSIPVSICNANLQVLDLSNNFLNGTIPQCFYGMTETLEVLDLRRNKLGGNLSDSFPVNCGLLTLNLNGNLLEGAVPKSLGYCTSLEVLDLGNNKIKDAFPCYLKNISSLHVLILRSNQFYGSIDCGGPNTSWPMLQIVDLASNNFIGQLPRESIFAIFAWKPMMDHAQSRIQYLQFGILQFSQNYYQDMIRVTVKDEQALIKGGGNNDRISMYLE